MITWQIHQGKLHEAYSRFFKMTPEQDAHSQATEDEIAECANYIWEQEGKPERRALDHWLQAEFQLAASYSLSNTSP
jgi:Protein of unknown function (DUF2934)